MHKDVIENLKEKIIPIFDKYFPGEYLFYIFGSFAKNTVDIASDIDLAVYSKEGATASLMAQVKEELENRVPTLRDIDLINLNEEGINQKLLENIVTEGLIWKKGRNSNALLRSLRKRLKNSKK